MVAPVRRTNSTPIDRNTEAEWRTFFGNWIGVTYANLPTSSQAVFDLLLDEAYESISEALGHRPHLKRRRPLSLVADQELYAMPTDYRLLRFILEGTGTSLTPVKVVTEEDYLNAFPDPTKSDTPAPHPWDDQADPRWFETGMDTSDPPVVIYQRVPTPTSAEAGTNNVTVMYRGLADALDTSVFNELPVPAQASVRNEFMAQWSAHNKNYQAAAFHVQMGDKALDRLKQNDMKEHEGPIWNAIPDSLQHELDVND